MVFAVLCDRVTCIFFSAATYEAAMVSAGGVHFFSIHLQKYPLPIGTLLDWNTFASTLTSDISLKMQ